MLIDGAIIAGGTGSRMGGADKGLLALHGQTFARKLANVITPHVTTLWINCNRNDDQYRAISTALVADERSELLGPLAGICAVMQASQAQAIITTACDTPCLPNDYATRLLALAQQHPNRLILAHDGERLQPLHGLWPCDLRDALAGDIEKGERRVYRWTMAQSPIACDFSDCPSAFTNVNTPDELARLNETDA